MLAPQLGLKDSEVETIKYDNPSFEVQKYKILSRWKQKNGSKGTLDRLISVLCYDLDWLDIAEEIVDHFKRKHLCVYVHMHTVKCYKLNVYMI